jgi:hypothetical protein
MFFCNGIYKNFHNIHVLLYLIRSKKRLLAPRGLNRGGIRQLSIKEGGSIVEVFIDSIREKNSATNEPTCEDSKLDFD